MNESKIIQNSEKSAQNSEFYETRWDTSNEWQGSHGYGKIRVEFIEYVLNKYVNDFNLSILDLGCGTGWLSKILSKYGTVDGVDFAAGLISIANEKYDEYGQFHVADPSSPTFGLKSNNYDLIVATEVIEHVENHNAFIEQLNLFIKPRGWLILTTENKAYYEHTMNDPSTKVQPIENWLSIAELRDLLEKFDYEIITHIGYMDATRFNYSFLTSYLGRPRLWNTLRRLGLQHQYGRLIRELGKYQLLIARAKF